VPAPLLDLPVAPEETILDAIAATLRDDPVLGPGGLDATFWLMEGDEDQEVLPDDTQIPVVRMRLGNYSTQQWAQNAHKGVLPVVFECFSPGLHRTDALRLTYAVFKAFKPDDPDRRAVIESRLNAAGRTHEQFSQAAGGQAKLGESWYGLQTNLTMNVTITRTY
jgi:hypothetical protein